MFSRRRFPIVAIIIGLAALVTGCSLLVAEEVPDPTTPGIVVPADPADFVVFTNFVDDEVGTVPAGWQSSIEDSLSVIIDDGLDSKRAIQGYSDPTRGRDNHIRTVGTFGSAASGVRTIAADYKVRLDSNYGINLNFSSSKGHHVNFYIDTGGELRYRLNDGLKNFPGSPILEIGEWYHLRVIADRQQEEFWLYIDDMETPLAGPLPFRTPIESWSDAWLLFLHGKQEGTASYGEVKIWAID